MCYTVHIWRSEDSLKDWPSPSTKWALGIELRSSALAADAFTACANLLFSLPVACLGCVFQDWRAMNTCP